MKRFMETNEITYNLMSFSGFKGILIFTFLLEGPKSYEQIQKHILDNEYLNESVSIDTIRIYLNSLKKIGCKIKTTTKNKTKYFSIENHPFELKISEKQTQSLLKVFRSIYSSIDFEDFVSLQSFFNKIEPYITNETIKNSIKAISPLENIDNKIIQKLSDCIKNKYGLTILYNSPTSGNKEIDILPDKLFITNSKLYLSGFNSEHQNSGNFLVSKILKIISIQKRKDITKLIPLKVKYILTLDNISEFEKLEEEKIIESNKNSITIEIESTNKFFITQRILSFSNKCKVISPSEYQEEIINSLKKMKEGYFEKQ